MAFCRIMGYRLDDYIYSKLLWQDYEYMRMMDAKYSEFRMKIDKQFDSIASKRGKSP